MIVRGLLFNASGRPVLLLVGLFLFAACSSQSPAGQGTGSAAAHAVAQPTDLEVSTTAESPGRSGARSSESAEKKETGVAPAGGTTADHGKPVGEAAKAEDGMAHNYDQQERDKLLRLARQTLESVVKTRKMPVVSPEDFAGHLSEKRGCFVTLTIRGHLRGCIGHIFAQEALYRAVMDNARAAALEDPRFPAVTPEELPSIHIEVSVLSEPKPLEFSSPEDLLAKLVPGRDGVVLKLGWRRSTFLPQVWEQLPDKEAFLNHLARKAGAHPDAWREPGTEVLIYHVEAFEEPH